MGIAEPFKGGGGEVDEIGFFDPLSGTGDVCVEVSYEVYGREILA